MVSQDSEDNERDRYYRLTLMGARVHQPNLTKPTQTLRNIVFQSYLPLTLKIAPSSLPSLQLYVYRTDTSGTRHSNAMLRR